MAFAAFDVLELDGQSVMGELWTARRTRLVDLLDVPPLGICLVPVDVIDRVPELGARGAYAKQAIRDKLLEHKAYIARHGDDMPDITSWRWGARAVSSARASSTEADNV
jgi:hypothetical protein